MRFFTLVTQRKETCSLFISPQSSSMDHSRGADLSGRDPQRPHTSHGALELLEQFIRIDGKILVDYHVDFFDAGGLLHRASGEHGDASDAG